MNSDHADGAVSFQDALLYWDNKFKETAVNLKDHIRQFDIYIKSSEKRVGGFLVVGPGSPVDLSSSVAW